MSEDTLYACAICLAKGVETTTIVEVANVITTYGGEVIKVDGAPVFENDEMGGEVFWDSTELKGYECGAWDSHQSETLAGLVVEVRRTDDGKLERVPEELGLA